MADLRTDTVLIDATHDVSEPLHRSVQALWREENAAFRARVLADLRQVRPRDASA